MYSAVLGLEVRIEGGELRFHDSETGESISTFTEQRQGRQQAEQALQQAEQERQQAEQERQQERLGRQQAERERQQEREARQQAEAARHAAEAQVAELRALLARHDPGADSGSA